MELDMTIIEKLKKNDDEVTLNGFNFSGDYETKNRFLRDCLISQDYTESSIISFKTLFSNKELKTYEEIFGKDIYDFSLGEIIQLVKLRKYPNEISLRSDISKLKAYKDYCIYKKIGNTNTNPLMTLETSDLMPYIDEYTKNNRYLTKNELLSVLEFGFSKEQEQLILLLPFYGIMGKRYEDMLSLRKNQYDINTKKITLDNGKKILIDDEEAAIIIEAAMIPSQHVPEWRKSRGVIYNKFLIEGVEDRPIAPSSVNRILKSLKDKKIVEHVTINSIFLSGITYRIAKQEIKQGYNFEYTEILKYLDKNEGGKRSNLVITLLPFMREKLKKELADGEEI